MSEVKICGLKDPAHAKAACADGVTYVGVVFAERLRRVSPEVAASVVAALQPAVKGVGVFVDAPVDEVLQHRDAVGFQIAQLHGSESPETCAHLAAEGLAVWKALRPTSETGLHNGWATYREVSDAILVEGFSLEAAGGTGSSFPYNWLGDLDRGDARLVLAGGLDAANVEAAIGSANPDVVDVSSGVESSPGVKSTDLIRAFLRAARATAASADHGVPTS